MPPTADALGININSLRSWRDAAQGAVVPMMVSDTVASTVTVHGPAGQSSLACTL